MAIPFPLLFLKVGESMVKVKALKPLGIKEGKVTVSKAPGAEFEMEEKDALAAEADGAVVVVVEKKIKEKKEPGEKPKQKAAADRKSGDGK